MRSRRTLDATWICRGLLAALLAVTPSPAQLQPNLQMLREGVGLQASDVEQMELLLQTNPNDVTSHLRLLGYYNSRPTNGVNTATIRARRLEQILWLINNFPNSELAGMAMARVLPRGGDFANEADYQRAKDAWLQQANNLPQDAVVQANAAQFLMTTEPELAELRLQQAVQAAPDNPDYAARLGTLYAMAVMGVTQTDDAGKPLAADLRTARSAFSQKALNTLETSSDANLVGAAARLLQQYSGTLKVKGNAQTDFRTLSSQLMQKASSLDPNNPAWAAATATTGRASAAAVSTSTAPAITVPMAEQDARLLQRVDPIYPTRARTNGVQGSVRVNITVGEDGRVRKAQAVSGPASLRDAALTAVKQYVYEPAQQNGAPVPVLSQVEVLFRLP